MAIQQLMLGEGELVAVVTATTTNLNVSTLFGSNYSASIAKRVIINSGVIVGSSNPASAALIIPSGLSGRLILENKGSIQGAGGAAGTAGAGGNGGDAISAQAAARIINNPGATIYGGGGGGGRGGNGGNGGGGYYTVSYDCSYNVYRGTGVGGAGDCNGACRNYYGGNAFCSGYCDPTSQYFIEYNVNGDPVYGTESICYDCYEYIPQTCYYNVYTSGGAGGAGGAGGVGRGYGQALAAGSAGAGGGAPGTNAGWGGTGGTGGGGGDYGASGGAGNTGGTGGNGNNGGGAAGSAGSSGGLAGFSINGLSSFITLTNSGAIAGRTN